MNQKTLDVYYHGQQVGTLALTADRLVAFQYCDSWLNDGFAISPFSLPLKDSIFVPTENSRDRFFGLFGVFADSLPDAWGQLLLNKYLEKCGFPKDLTALDKLAFVGKSGMGALEYLPSRNADFSFAGLDYDLIARECANLLSSRPSDQLDALYNLSGSIGGTRPKILISEEENEFIVKFPAKNDPVNVGKQEYDYSLCAKKCGIAMSETDLIPSHLCEGYFKTGRFDRTHGTKLMTLTFAAILEADYRVPSCDYSAFMKLVNVLTREDLRQVEQMFRIMCFNVFTHNLDDHTKNFSFIRSDNRWELAPAYDLTYSDTYFGEHTTSVNGKGSLITDHDLTSVGVEAGLKKTLCQDIIAEIREKTSDLECYLGTSAKIKSKKVSFEERLRDLN